MTRHLIHPQPLERFVNLLLTRSGADEDIAGEVANHSPRPQPPGSTSTNLVRPPASPSESTCGYPTTKSHCPRLTPFSSPH